MSKCPFWSIKKESFSCYDECPMKAMSSEDGICIFTEVLDEPKVAYKEVINEEFVYSEEKRGEYDFLKKTSSY